MEAQQQLSGWWRLIDQGNISTGDIMTIHRTVKITEDIVMIYDFTVPNKVIIYLNGEARNAYEYNYVNSELDSALFWNGVDEDRMVKIGCGGNTLYFITDKIFRQFKRIPDDEIQDLLPSRI